MLFAVSAEGCLKTELRCAVAGCVFGYMPPMHEVVVKVVAMAVSTVMTMFRILFQSSFFISIQLTVSD